MPEKETAFSLPSNIKLTFRPRLSGSSERDARNFYPLHKHLQKLSIKLAELPPEQASAHVHIRDVVYFDDEKKKVGLLNATTTYLDAQGKSKPYHYIIDADGVGILPIFKLAGMEVNGREAPKPDAVTFAVMTIREPRLNLADFFAPGLMGGAVDAGETFERAARREVKEESGWEIPVASKLTGLDLPHTPTKLTGEDKLFGVYHELDWKRPDDRDFIPHVTRPHGDSEEGERTHPELVSFPAFLSLSPLKSYNLLLGAFVSRIAVNTGDEGPLRAYKDACRAVGCDGLFL